MAAEPGLAGLVVGVATGVNPLKTGEVGVTSEATGEVYPSGVEACSVAYRSEPGVAGAVNKLQPSMKSSAAANPRSLIFCGFQLDRFKFKFLAR